MTESNEPAHDVKIVVDSATISGESSDEVRARLHLDGSPEHEIIFTLSSLDFMRSTSAGTDELWDRALEEMAARLSAELTYAGLTSFRDPIVVQSHSTSGRLGHRTGLRTPGTVLAEFLV